MFISDLLLSLIIYALHEVGLKEQFDIDIAVKTHISSI